MILEILKEIPLRRKFTAGNPANHLTNNLGYFGGSAIFKFYKNCGRLAENLLKVSEIKDKKILDDDELRRPAL